MLGFLAVVLAGLACAAAPQPKLVTRAQWGSRPDPIPESRRHTPAWITIHHAGELWTAGKDPVRFVRNLQSWGKLPPEPPRRAVWPDLPYHYLIAPDGRIFEGRPVEYEPETNTDYPVAGNIGVELMGDFEKQRPSARQLESLVALVAWLADTHAIAADHIRGHKDAIPPGAEPTDCPGMDVYRYLQDGQLGRWIAQTRGGRKPKIEAGLPLPGGPSSAIPLR